MNIPLSKPYVDQEIKDKILEVLDSGWITIDPIFLTFWKVQRIAAFSCLESMMN
jgi:dTDP-4-amino-4,6-dideoxygalactose transaminase